MSTASLTGRALTKGLSWVLVGNVLYMLSAALLTLVLPRIISVADYGLWQLYQLYVMYFGYVTFGYTDGVYLRLGGRRYADMPGPRLSAGLIRLLLADLAAWIGLVVWVWAVSPEPQRGLILVLAGVGAVFYVSRTLVTVILQIAGRARAFALGTVVERLVTFVGVGGALLVGAREVIVFIIFDVLGKLIGLVVAVLIARGVFLSPPDFSWEATREFFADCGAGMFVLVSNLAAALITFVVRWAVESHWGLEMFAQVSLAFQFTTMFMVLVNSVSISVYPQLSNLDRTHYAGAYATLRARFVTPLVLMLGLYFPLAWVLRAWLPRYGQAIFFLALLFPLSVYETKSRGLSVVFLKVLRRERLMAVINVACLGLAVVGTWWTVYTWGSVTAAVFLIAVVSAVRSIASEVLINRLIGVPILADTLTELLVCAVFLAVVALGGPPVTLLAVYATLGVYGYVHRDSLRLPRRLHRNRH
ncbi:hypothetical protein [Actinomyces sp. MRS3W]|uniref:lipopolysaccharide biosynthesis protein n=1 Tax=Actinomyces sp. MRS3W TaxID=2800796 RepID=UPI0028FD34AE|nr:hypothetical protein [Actinomyces sp. MRS3W]MDU0348859.1 hypothetical protein [Actinomyces sp. MRS3W]